MRKSLKKLFAGVSALTVFTTVQFSSTAVYTQTELPTLNKYTILDDKGMLNNNDTYMREGYKILCDGEFLYRAMPEYRSFKFVLDENINYEDAHDRVVEIFREFYPEENYTNEYVPCINAYTFDGITTYTSYFAYQPVSTANDEAALEAKKYSMDIMKKLDEENLISAFYDVGEVYEITQYDTPYIIAYDIDVDIDLINDFIEKNNIECSIENVNDKWYKLIFDDNKDIAEQFLIASDIYEATSIKCNTWSVQEYSTTIYGSNALDEISENTSTTITTPVETTSTTISTQITEIPKPVGDADGDNKITVRDCSRIAVMIAEGKSGELSENADFNKDGKVNVRDAAAIAKTLAKA